MTGRLDYGKMAPGISCRERTGLPVQGADE
jgi:hypothetical protein